MKYKELYEKEIIPLYNDACRYLFHLGCDGFMAQDIVQNTMKKAWEIRNKLPEIENKKAWIFHVSHNEFMSYLRTKGRLCEYDDDDMSLSGMEATEIIRDISNFLAEAEDADKIRQALKQLDEKYAVLITMRFYSDLKHREIAEIMDMNENTVRSSVARGLKKLRIIYEKLEERGDHDEDRVD